MLANGAGQVLAKGGVIVYDAVMLEAIVPREPVVACPVCGGPDRTDFLTRADLVRCVGCDALYVSPRPTDEAIQAFYSALGRYDHWDREPGRARMWERRVARIRRHVAGGRLLDVGTGQGDFGAVAKRHFEVEATEVSSEGARLGRERHGLTIHEGDLLSLDLPRRRFQAITMWHVLEHVANPREVVERCWELLDDGGVIAIAVPNADEDLRLTRRRWDGALQFALGRPARERVRIPVVDSLISVATGTMPARDVHIPRLMLDHPEEEIHLTHFSLDTLGRMLTAVGFDVLERGIDDHSPELALAARLRHHRHVAFHRLTGHAAANAIFVAARKVAR